MRTYLLLAFCVILLIPLVIVGCGGGDGGGIRDAIAFMREGDYYQVWLMFSDGSKKRAIAVFDDRDALQGTLSRDGRRVLYVDDYTDLVEYDLSNGDRDIIYSSGGADILTPAYSPDGSQIAFAMDTADGTPAIYVIDSDGTDLDLLTNDGNASTQETMPFWDPDDPYIYFQRGTNWWGSIYRVSTSGGTPDLIKAEDGVQWLHPRVFSDDRLLVTRSGPSSQDIYLMDDDGTDEINLTPDTDDTDEYFPSINQAENRIVFSRDDEEESNIYIANFDGDSLSNVRNLTNDLGDDAWRPFIGRVDADYWD